MGKTESLTSCLGCSVLIAVLFACIGVAQFGTASLAVSILAFAAGATVGAFLGTAIGVASGGHAKNGVMPLALLFGVISLLIVNNTTWMTNKWLSDAGSWISSQTSSVAPTPTSGTDAVAYEEDPFDLIIRSLGQLLGDERERFKKSLIGETLQVKGVVSDVGRDDIALLVGYDDLKTRVEVSISPSEKVPASIGGTFMLKVPYERGDFITVKGIIYEIGDLPSLTIRITDAEIEHDE